MVVKWLGLWMARWRGLLPMCGSGASKMVLKASKKLFWRRKFTMTNKDLAWNLAAKWMALIPSRVQSSGSYSSGVPLPNLTLVVSERSFFNWSEMVETFSRPDVMTISMIIWTISACLVIIARCSGDIHMRSGFSFDFQCDFNFKDISILIFLSYNMFKAFSWRILATWSIDPERMASPKLIKTMSPLSVCSEMLSVMLFVTETLVLCISNSCSS